MNYCKVIFGQDSYGGRKKYTYKINKENIAENWNPSGVENKTTNGFYFSTKETVLRWLIRGDTFYDIIIPEDAEVIESPGPAVPQGSFVTNKLILTNPRPITDELATELYKISLLPEKTYYKSLCGCAVRGYINTCKLIIKEKVNKDNIDLVLLEFLDFVTPQTTTIKGDEECYNKVLKILRKIKEER